MSTCTLVVSIAHRALDIRARDIRPILLLLVKSSVHGTKLAPALLLLRVIVDRLVIENAVLVVTKQIKKSHSVQI